MPIEHQIVVIYGGVRGYLDAIEIKDIVAFVKPHLLHTLLPITLQSSMISNPRALLAMNPRLS